MSDDDMFDRWVVDAAAEYNRPPATVPREAMWSVIRAGVAAAPIPEARRLAARSWTLRQVVPLLAAAAVLVAVAYQAGVTTGAPGPPATPPVRVKARRCTTWLRVTSSTVPSCCWPPPSPR
ncbi:MAG: hypothetical protein IPK85_10120 [Gemmatimonadetes bacterium]|nr:hypothetical protein [Gemmatimonadota bacterium]